MARRPREIELAVERPLGPEGAGVARLTARFALGPGEDAPTPAELARTLDDLRADLDALVGPPLAAVPALRPDRDLAELVGAYRPRQRELVDLLRDEGELTPGEHALLAAYLASGSGTSPTPPAPERLPDPPIAAVPILAERSAEPVRPVPQLLSEYGIASLKQAGAVRARRQISFGEYMALKRYFESRGSGAAAEPAADAASGSR